jgi:hypothetical protein
MRSPRDFAELMPDDSSTHGYVARADTVAAPGSLSFELKATSCGVDVLRLHRRDDGTNVYCSVLFGDEREFLDWLDADPLRYVHPLVFQQARRCVGELLAHRDHHDTVRT